MEKISKMSSLYHTHDNIFLEQYGQHAQTMKLFLFCDSIPTPWSYFNLILEYFLNKNKE